MVTSTKASTDQLTALTWNIEGIKRHSFLLSEILNTELPSLVFLSEPQVYQCDLSGILQYIDQEYCHSLNSEDIYETELPLLRSEAKGGTQHA